MNILKIIRNIFSVYNQKYHKAICIFGIKIKFFNPKKYTQYKTTILKKYAEKQKLNDKAFKSLSDRIKNLESRGFKVQDLNKEIILSNKRIRIATDSYAWIAQEVFYDELYKLPKSLLKKNTEYCVLDIGANRCYTALYFADKKWCKRVDSFEIMPQTFKLALKNIKLNNRFLQNKIYAYNLGLGSENKEIEALYIPNRDGISTSNLEWLKSYAPNVVQKGKPTECKIVQASVFLKELIEQHNISNIIFKIDVEGVEYDILQDLADNYPEIFKKIEIMIGDTHCGFEKFLKIVAPFNFKIVEAKPETNGSCSFILINNRKGI
ncbi:MAG: FkbM family methyltransferase [Candidatus Gastranaerophilales bacterium]|nr:FkbM family methyltransferase [Candidatus Gastranaerophilales bacterium]